MMQQPRHAARRFPSDHVSTASLLQLLHPRGKRRPNYDHITAALRPLVVLRLSPQSPAYSYASTGPSLNDRGLTGGHMASSNNGSVKNTGPRTRFQETANIMCDNAGAVASRVSGLTSTLLTPAQLAVVLGEKKQTHRRRR